MKIGLVSPYDWAYPGGVANHIRNLSDQFRAMGHRTTIIAPSSKRASDLNTDNLVVIGKPVPLPIGGSVARITLSFHRTPQVRALLEDEEFDVLHIHEPLLPALPLWVLRYSNTLNVGTFHLYHRNARGYRAWRPILKRWEPKIHGRIAVSRPAAEIVAKSFPGDYTIIPNGIDLAYFSADAPPFERFNDGKINILFVGRMEKRKGLRHLLAAYSRIKWEFPDTRLIVVGPGKPDAASERVLGERDLHDVVFAGGVDYADLPRYYRSAHIFCSPATGGESFGIVLLEAMAAGKPVLASDIPGYATVVQHGVQGLLVEPQNEERLAEGLVQLITDPALRRRLGDRGREHAQNYSWKRIAVQVMDFYGATRDRREQQRRTRTLP